MQTFISTYHMISVTRIITASLREEKKAVKGLALTPIFPSTTPNTMENTAKPRMFMPPVGLVATPANIVLEGGYISLDIMVMFSVALVIETIFSFSSSFGELPVTLRYSYLPGSVL